MFTLESRHRGDSNEYTQCAIFQYEKEKHAKLSEMCSYGMFYKGLKNEFEKALVNEPPVFEPLKFYCTSLLSVPLYVSFNVAMRYKFDVGIKKTGNDLK